MATFENFLESSMRTATPLALAALGEVVVERAGIINIGLEGLVIGGAFGALVGASMGGTVTGIIAATLAGMLLAALLFCFVDLLNTDQIIAGTAITILSLGLTGALYRTFYGNTSAALSLATLPGLAVPGLAGLPVIGPALFDQSVLTYLVYGMVPGLWWVMHRTHLGLSLRSIGEAPAAAMASGIAVRRLRLLALLFGGAMGGLSGGTLVIGQVGTFAENMSAGRGFIAIAVVVLGRWNPLGVGGAALVFGAASALQFWVQTMSLDLPYQLVLAFPYLLTLAALAGVAGRARAPAAMGKSLASFNS